VCGAPLILVGTTTDQIEGTLFPQTTSTYRCSNSVCQEEKDRQKAIRVKLQDERRLEGEKRAGEKLRQKNMKLTKHIK
jgi:hypothetical protein